MSTEEEFERWLRRPEKSFLENFQFALKAWQSAEFTLSSKYEVILAWISEDGAKQTTDFPATEYSELLQLRAQPGLIAQKTKRQFVEMMLKIADEPQSTGDDIAPRTMTELLRRLVEFELLQDLFRSDYELHALVYAKLFECYESYLCKLTSNELRPAYETEFFVAATSSLRDSAKRTGDPTQFEQFYTKHTLQPLAQVLLVLRQLSLCFFDDLLALESHLCEPFSEDVVLERILKLPLHVRLLTLECAIISRRGVERFMQLLLKLVFFEHLNAERQSDAGLALTVAAYTLEMLRKHDVTLTFQISANSKETALAFLGMQLFRCVQQCKEMHLREVLMLLCATLRLNPLILEQHIFQVTTWMMVNAKANDREQQLFEEFLVLMIDMFRRLSRAEKFVVNLLKALKEWLVKFKLPTSLEKGKRKATAEAKKTPAKKPKTDEGESAAVAEEGEDSAKVTPYLQTIFKDFYKPSNSAGGTVAAAVAHHSFPQLHSAWPSASVGVAFSKLITGLVSKPSLVIWKSLLYSLKELLETLKNTKELDENSLFHLDLHAALLCQYLAGSRLSEQSEKYFSEIAEQRHFTAQVLSIFGRYLLSRQHQKRIMNAFLECSFQVASFELLLVYYRPDGLSHVDFEASVVVERLHAFLSEQEWTLIQLRVLNFGKSSCKHLLNRLLLQRSQAQLLLLRDASDLSLEKLLLSPACSDHEQIDLMLHAPNAKWLIAQLGREEKLEITKGLVEKPSLLRTFTDDLEALELISLNIYHDLCEAFTASSKGSLLAAFKCDFDALRRSADDPSVLDKNIQLLVEVINSRLNDYSLKKFPKEETQRALNSLRQLPIGHLRRPNKSLLFALHLAFYRDLKAAQADDLATEAFAILTDLLHFGQQVPIFKYFPTESIIKLLPVASCWEFYEFLFGTIKNEEKFTERFLIALTEILKEAQSAGSLSDDQRQLTLIAIETLAGINGPGAKRMRRHLDGILEVYADYVNAHFGQEAPTTGSGSSKKDKKFVDKTLAGFGPYVKAVLAKSTAPSAEDGEQQQKSSPVNENFRRICKIYIGHSIDYRNTHAIRLMQVVLNYRQQLHLDQDEIEFVLSGYWQQLNADLNNAQPLLNTKAIESVVKLIIGNKTNEDLLTLKDIGSHVHDEKDFANVTRLLALIAKCAFSTIKGAIFNEQFKLITCEITARLAKNEQQQFVNTDHVLSVLACQQSIVENKMIPISTDTLDSILALLLDINVKKFPLSDTNGRLFHSLHLAMSELCTSLVKHRHILLMDRVPQFMHILKDLLQAVVWYKSDRQKDTALAAEELDDLAELALKLEALMHVIATHSVDVKRVAPFVLTFVINLMVANKRPTTLYTKIKTHIESICYDLIGICDHRVGRFILRCSNEAARQVYELLVKDHKKYHKFKGKV